MCVLSLHLFSDGRHFHEQKGNYSAPESQAAHSKKSKPSARGKARIRKIRNAVKSPGSVRYSFSYSSDNLPIDVNAAQHLALLKPADILHGLTEHLRRRDFNLHPHFLFALLIQLEVANMSFPALPYLIAACKQAKLWIVSIT